MTDPKDAAEQRLEIKENELLGPGLIHEMRHPLMGIKAGLELIGRRAGSEVKGLEEWEMLTGQVARLEELFRTYQDLFTPQRSNVVSFAVEDVVQRSVDLLAYRLRRFGARFSFDRSGAAARVSGVPNALLHAITNLLVNASDSVEESGGSGRIEIRVVRPATGWVEVRISDAGAGIAPAVADLLFEQKITTKAAGKGTGLGLHIARTVMRRFGGDVRLAGADESLRAPWASAEFAIALPEERA